MENGIKRSKAGGGMEEVTSPVQGRDDDLDQEASNSGLLPDLYNFI